jgi:hypothetical protein
MLSRTWPRTGCALLRVAANSRLHGEYTLTNDSGVNLPPLMFDGREDSKQYVLLEGVSLILIAVCLI